MSFNSNTEVAIQKLLNYIQNDPDFRKVSASGGSKLYADTSNHIALDVKTIYVREDTVISTLLGKDINGNDIDYITEFNITGETLKLGDLYPVPNNWKITNITLTSGSIIAYS